jgi:hypothetical protein
VSVFAQTLYATFSLESLFYRPFNVDDTSEFRKMTDDPAVTDSISFLSTPFTLDDATQFLKTCAQNMSVYMAAAVSQIIGLFR